MLECDIGKYEKTIIVIREDNANILTSVPATARTLDRLCDEHPEKFKPDKTHRITGGANDGKIDWKSYNVSP